MADPSTPPGGGADLGVEAYGQGVAGSGLGAGEGPQHAARSFAPPGRGPGGGDLGGAEPAGDHDGWSPSQDALDTIATTYARRGGFNCESPAGVLRDRVVSRLMADRLLDCSGIEVQVEEGVVTLAGWVRRPSDIALAELIAGEAAAGCAEIRLALGVKSTASERG